jgi:hypothetical protein
MARTFIIALLAVCCALPGMAHAADTELCRNGSFPEQAVSFGLAKVVGAPRIYLRSDMPPCPDDSTACRGRAYVVPGNRVLTGPTSGSYVCALFPDGNGGSAGYVRRDEIAPQPVAADPPLAAWAGKWRNFDNSIALRVDGNALTASGSAYWPSANPSPRTRPGGPNLGNMGGTATPKGNVVVFADDDPAACRITLTLLPPFLLAVDNRNCGGMNVSFTGVYIRR